MTDTQAQEAARLAEWLQAAVQTYPQMSEDEPGGYCTEVDQVMDEAAALLRTQAARIAELEKERDELRDRILIGAAISLIRKPAAAFAATMTDTDIIRIAREAGFMTGTRDYANGKGGLPFVMPIGTSTCLPELARFAALVAEATKQEGEPHA